MIVSGDPVVAPEDGGSIVAQPGGVGYYVHHHGRGHLHRAAAIAAALDLPVTGLSSLPRPSDWAGEWVSLPLDVAEGAPPKDQTAHGRLHWVPTGTDGLRERMAMVAAWIAAARPRVFVSDVSVEVALLARLHGVPVVSVALPGIRDDAAHALGFDVSTAIISAWPPGAAGMIEGLSASARARLHPVGAISRFPFCGRAAAPRGDGGPRRALVLAGAGGDGFTSDAIAAARASTPGWQIAHLGGSSGSWVADPRTALVAADVVVTHAGQNAVADVASARRPAVIVPQDRPHDEQRTTGRVLGAGDWPAVVVPEMPTGGWGGLLDAAFELDGSRWRDWNDGGGAARAAHVIGRVAAGECAVADAGSAGGTGPIALRGAAG